MFNPHGQAIKNTDSVWLSQIAVHDKTHLFYVVNLYLNHLYNGIYLKLNWPVIYQ